MAERNPLNLYSYTHSMWRLFILLCSVFCLSFSEINKQPDFKLTDGKVLVKDKLYCLYEQLEPGSRSFQIKTPDGEVVIVCRVKVEGVPEGRNVKNYFSILFIPSGKELNLRYNRKFPDRFINSVVSYDILQDGFWNESGAQKLYNDLQMDKDLMFTPSKIDYVYNNALSEKIGSAVIDITTDKRIIINDSATYKYSIRNNYTRNHRYWQGTDEIRYRIYDNDSNLCAEVGVGHHLSKVPKNISVVLYPEGELYYLRHLDAGNENAVITAAVKLILVRKWK